ncbi:hypothetical protein BDF20DRAFT_857637 [Mycotypha africana]|uniref:uncharacterized protein n=1 Tax=Mycotypha africana TaxID=64632 RepID=UPI0023011D71|nr:uncharacterized protein BDF20DRAFT_857637 [Mycotypha africana]KAI8984035.1 hypothetical protein BDF20DRAFT_857637 [Mycotypha africana]
MRILLFIFAAIVALVTVASAAKLSTVSPSKKPQIKTLTKSALPSPNKKPLIKTLTNMPPAPSSPTKTMIKTVQPISSTKRGMTPSESRASVQKYKSYHHCIMMNNHARHDPRKSWTPLITCVSPS